DVLGFLYYRFDSRSKAAVIQSLDDHFDRVTRVDDRVCFFDRICQTDQRGRQGVRVDLSAISVEVQYETIRFARNLYDCHKLPQLVLTSELSRAAKRRRLE